MDLRRFLPDLKNWTLGEIACAAGLVVLSAGAGYSVYRCMRRGSAPPDHTQPPHEPEDVLEESIATPSVLQVLEPNLQLLPTEHHQEPSAVVLSVDIRRDFLGMIRGTESRLCWLETTETQRLNHEGFHYYNNAEDCFTGIQVVETNLQLLPTEPHHDPSAVVLPLSAGEMSSAWSDVQFLSADSFSFQQSGSVDIRRYFLGMMRGPESRLCWFKTTKTRWLNHEGFPYYSETEDCFTGIQSVSGRVTEIISCHRMETVTVEFEDYVQPLKKVTCTFLYVGPDGQVDTSTWVQKENCNSPHSDSESEPDWEETEEGLTPEEMEVPFISYHLSDRGVPDIGLKLHALRQAFSTLLASIHNQNFLFVVGKKIVMRLAAANNQDVFGVQLAYESLVRFLRKPSYQESIMTELFGAQLHHYNFLDVFYELLLFGYFGNGSAPEAFEGGFLERLFALVSMWDVDVWEPAAELYFTALIDRLTVLCEVLFSQPLELYSDPAALSSAVSRLLKQHVQLMMDTLEKL